LTLHGFVDGELDAAHSLQIEQHIATCPHCAKELESLQALKQRIAQRGERIGLNFQYVYTEAAFHWLLHSQGGLEIVKLYRSPDGRFLTALCKK